MAQPTVSVVIPAYRSQRTIGRAIDSVLAQTVRATEIIVVDDGSPDDQVSVIQQYGSPVVLLCQTNAGTAAARNRGIDRATGHFIAFLDADDYWESDKLQRQLEIFDSHPEVGLVGSRFFEQPPGAPRTLPTRSAAEYWYDRVLHVSGPRRVSGPQRFRVGTLLWTGTVIVRCDALGQHRFVSGLEPAEDRDLWIRLAAEAASYLLSQPLSTAVLEPGSLSRSDLARDCSNMLAVVEKHRELLGPVSTRLWRSHTFYRWAALDPSPRTALPRLLRSFALWPLPYRSIETARPWGRLKRLLVLLLASCRRRRWPATGAAT